LGNTDRRPLPSVNEPAATNIVAAGDVLVPWPVDTHACVPRARLDYGVVLCPQLEAAVKVEVERHQQLRLMDAAQDLIAQAAIGTVLSIEDVSRKRDLDVDALAAGLDAISLQGVEKDVNDQRRNLERAQRNLSGVKAQLKAVQAEVQ
jgi:hypothetical protein